jgi:hypothetical protein
MNVVYSSIYGSYDRLKPHPDSPDVDEWVCYTDDPSLTCDGWRVIVEPARFPHPRLSAKWRKCHPPEHATRSLWVDGSMLVIDPAFYTEAFTRLGYADMVMFSHPERTSIIAEAGVSEGMVKYRGLAVMQQAQHYCWGWNWPDTTLWASTTIGRNHTPRVLQAGAAWFAENAHWTYQDQISLPPVLDRYGIDVAALPYSLWANPWFTLRAHTSDA